MSQQDVIAAPRKPGNPFKPGHERVGGRKKHTAQMARDLANELGVDPLAFMMHLIKSDTIKQTVIVDGKKTRQEIVIPLDMRLDAAKSVANYIYPKLATTQISGANGGPIEVSTFDITKLLQDPEALDAAQKLAFAMNRGELSDGGQVIEGTAIPATEEAKALPTAERNSLDDLALDHKGHWVKR